jgi:Cys-tRNA synthase (O-phospho-L-seryl-tRNA:Cys-tRNA synthase)
MKIKRRIIMDREPKSGRLVAADTVAALYAAYVSAERKGREVEVPIDPTLR